MIYTIQTIKTSLAERKLIKIPSISRIILFLVFFLLIYIILSVILVPHNQPYYHFGEEGAITALSAVMLAMAGGFAGCAFFLSRRRGDFLRYFWFLNGLGFSFFALDELLQFHEKLGNLITKSPIGPTETFRNWNDVIVIGYGVIAIGVLLYFLPEIFRYPKFVELLLTSCAFYFIHTLIDSTQERSTISVIFEESAKLFSSTFFAISMFVGLVGIVASIKSNNIGRSNYWI